MKVSEVINLLAYGTEWQLIGAHTGKKLCTSRNTDKQKNKFMDMETTDSPIFPSFRTQDNFVTKTCEHIYPIINIWVSGM